MNRDDLRRSVRPAEESGELLYEALGGMLQRMLASRFGVPAREAEKLIQEIFIDYVACRTAVADPKGWLIGATFTSGANWQRVHAGTTSLPPGRAELREMRSLLTLPSALDALPKAAKEILRLRFQEKRTFEEIAAELGVSAFYAEAAVKKASSRLRKIARSKKQ